MSSLFSEQTLIWPYLVAIPFKGPCIRISSHLRLSFHIHSFGLKSKGHRLLFSSVHTGGSFLLLLFFCSCCRALFYSVVNFFLCFAVLQTVKILSQLVLHDITLHFVILWAFTENCIETTRVSSLFVFHHIWITKEIKVSFSILSISLLQ